MIAPWRVAGVIILLASVTGCAPATPAPQPANLYNKVDLSFECVTSYRSSVQSQIQQRDRVTLTNASQTAVVTYPNLVFNALYSPGGYDVPYLKVWVTSADSRDELDATLYQFYPMTSTLTQFGGLGFTGLHYTYHPETRAELQFLCTVTR
jgi:hypothetical protein